MKSFSGFGSRAMLLGFSLNFLGFYSILLVFANLNLLSFSRFVSIPLRVLIVACLCLALLKLGRLTLKGSSLLFLSFSMLFFLRMFIDYLLDRELYTSYSQVFFYFLTFGFMPFLLMRHTKLNFEILHAMKKWFFFSAFAFSSLAILSYAKFIGQVGRLTPGVSKDELISPLILSYCSAMVLGVGLNLWLTKKNSSKDKIFLTILMLLALAPFFLGASRGSIFAIALPIIFMVITNRRLITNLKVIMVSFIALISLVIISGYFGSNIFGRFLNTFTDDSTNNSEGGRMWIWKQSLNQFLDSPIIGDRIGMIEYNNYPHNIFLEVLQSLGIVGFVPFIFLVAIGLKECFLLFRYYREYSWIGVIFLQSLAQNFFSGAIYTASWFWFSLALVISVRLSLKRLKRTNDIPLLAKFD